MEYKGEIKNMTYEIKIGNEIINKFQRLEYSIMMRKNIIKEITIEHKDDKDIINSEMFKLYWNELEEMNAEYELMKNEITSLYVPKEIRENHNWNWNIDYINEVLVLKINCDCGIKLYEKLTNMGGE